MKKALFSILSAGMVVLTAMPAQAFVLPMIRINVMVPAPRTRVVPAAPVQVCERRHERNRPYLAPESRVVYVTQRPAEHRQNRHRSRQHPRQEVIVVRR